MQSRKKGLDRRAFLNAGLELLASGAAIAIAVSVADKLNISFQEAMRDASLRQKYIDQLVGIKRPDYVVSVDYADPDLLKRLRSAGYVQEKGVYADTIGLAPASDKDDLKLATVDNVGDDIRSMVVVLPSVFADPYAEYPILEEMCPRPDMYICRDIIIKNIILNNEFVDAKHFNQGIPGLSTDDFYAMDGNFNVRLYTSVSDIISNATERAGLKKHPRYDEQLFLQTYAESLMTQIIKLYDNLPKLSQDMDPNFMAMLQHVFHPNKMYMMRLNQIH